eukprot:351522-Chlamydomonas_euryale.AAC.1
MTIAHTAGDAIMRPHGVAASGGRRIRCCGARLLRSVDLSPHHHHHSHVTAANRREAIHGPPPLSGATMQVSHEGLRAQRIQSPEGPGTGASGHRGFGTWKAKPSYNPSESVRLQAGKLSCARVCVGGCGGVPREPALVLLADPPDSVVLLGMVGAFASRHRLLQWHLSEVDNSLWLSCYASFRQQVHQRFRGYWSFRTHTPTYIRPFLNFIKILKGTRIEIELSLL